VAVGVCFFFYQAEDGIRDKLVTGVQTCALPIWWMRRCPITHSWARRTIYATLVRLAQEWVMRHRLIHPQGNFGSIAGLPPAAMQIGRAARRERRSQRGVRRSLSARRQATGGCVE